MELFWITVFAVTSFLVIYHHLLFPVLLKRMGQHSGSSRQMLEKLDESNLPTMTIVMPAYNEADSIRDKLLNLSVLDYPKDLLNVVIANDGSKDNTLQIIEETLASGWCQELNVSVINFEHNQGKTKILNKVLPNVFSEITVMTDVSALLSIDSLKMISMSLASEKVGVVTGHYQLLSPGSDGEAVYWNYQSQIKQNESDVHSTMGCHGALYAFKTELFERLSEDTINDDFVIPMKIVEKGYRSIYEKDIHAVELEQSQSDQDFNRRVRISAGNIQQVVMLISLLNPMRGKVAFTFFSGKFLRVLMPICLLLVLVSSAALSRESLFFLTLFVAQVLVYGVCTWVLISQRQPASRVLRVVQYIFNGHLANLIGLIKFISGKQNKTWQKSVTNN